MSCRGSAKVISCKCRIFSDLNNASTLNDKLDDLNIKIVRHGKLNWSITLLNLFFVVIFHFSSFTSKNELKSTAYMKKVKILKKCVPRLDHKSHTEKSFSVYFVHDDYFHILRASVNPFNTSFLSLEILVLQNLLWLLLEQFLNV